MPTNCGVFVTITIKCSFQGDIQIDLRKGAHLYFSGFSIFFDFGYFYRLAIRLWQPKKFYHIYAFVKWKELPAATLLNLIIILFVILTNWALSVYSNICIGISVSTVWFSGHKLKSLFVWYTCLVFRFRLVTL